VRERDRLPAESLSPLAAAVDEVLALYRYELTPAIEAIDDAVPGHGGLFHPATSADTLRSAVETVAAAPPPPAPGSGLNPGDSHVVYVDGSSRGNPGPAGAGAVVQVDEEAVARLGRPVGARTDNNTAEYAALQLGLHAVLSRWDPAAVEVRIDSMTVIDDIWRGNDATAAPRAYGAAIEETLSTVPTHEWTHLADSDPNPADALATVGADIAALGPGG
jgi:ribonuclease HI